jgi:hypothetical protein
MIHYLTDIVINSVKITLDSFYVQLDVIEEIDVAKNFEFVFIDDVYDGIFKKKLVLKNGYFKMINGSFDPNEENYKRIREKNRLVIHLKLQRLTLDELREELLEREMYEDLAKLKSLLK